MSNDLEEAEVVPGIFSGIDEMMQSDLEPSTDAKNVFKVYEQDEDEFEERDESGSLITKNLKSKGNNLYCSFDSEVFYIDMDAPVCRQPVKKCDHSERDSVVPAHRKSSPHFQSNSVLKIYEEDDDDEETDSENSDIIIHLNKKEQIDTETINSDNDQNIIGNTLINYDQPLGNIINRIKKRLKESINSSDPRINSQNKESVVDNKLIDGQHKSNITSGKENGLKETIDGSDLKMNKHKENICGNKLTDNDKLSNAGSTENESNNHDDTIIKSHKESIIGNELINSDKPVSDEKNEVKEQNNNNTTINSNNKVEIPVEIITDNTLMNNEDLCNTTDTESRVKKSNDDGNKKINLNSEEESIASKTFHKEEHVSNVDNENELKNNEEIIHDYYKCVTENITDRDDTSKTDYIRDNNGNGFNKLNDVSCSTEYKSNTLNIKENFTITESEIMQYFSTNENLTDVEKHSINTL